MDLLTYIDELQKIAEEERLSDAVLDRHLPATGATALGAYGAANTRAFVPDKIFPAMKKVNPRSGRARLVSGLFGASTGASLSSLPGTLTRGWRTRRDDKEKKSSALGNALNYGVGATTLAAAGAGGFYGGRKLREKKTRKEEMRKRRARLRRELARRESDMPWVSTGHGGAGDRSDIPDISMNSQYDTTWDTTSA